ncbi:LamB/YcsF family protein [Halopenitus persicus]|uniref:LamB/YcsF family protein n=1 Tax=Halopenitus persicus TaxID=1048396 RepID=UPI000BBAB614|nr:5-oxoprolinase subunit PxpA [Halopenitus persicus]
MTAIDLNCDMGESFGNYRMGDDEAVMPYITSANVAGGFHAGDPHVLFETIELAAEHDVGIGVHPGLPDKIGFGRRTMDATPAEVRDYVIYQLGAVLGVAKHHGVEVQHVKPHGAMYSMLSESEEHTRAVIEAILEVDPSLIYLATDRNILAVAREYDALDTVFEGYVDLDYAADGTIIVEQRKKRRDPELVADRVVSIAEHGTVEAADGTTIDLPADSICIHGDGPNAVELLRTIHDRLDAEGIDRRQLSELV